jgi:ligand-binding sensor domain-containing protein
MYKAKERNRISILLLCSMVLLSSILNAQNVLTTYTQDNSVLPDNKVRCVEYDYVYKNIFVGTDFGLVKIDSLFEWSVYNTQNSALTHNSIRSLYFKDSTLYIGTLAAGIYKLKNNLLSIFTGNNFSLPSPFVKAIHIDSYNNLWLGTDNGLVKYNYENIQLYNHLNSVFTSDNVFDINSTDTTVLVAYNNGGLGKITPNTVNVFTIATSNIPDNSITSLAIDTLHNFWGTTPANGLFVNLGFPIYNLINSSIISNDLNQVYIDQNNKKYVLSKAGFSIFDNVTWKNFSINNFPFLNDNFVDLVKVKDVLWMATDMGLVRFDEALYNSMTELSNLSFTYSIKNKVMYFNTQVDKVEIFDLLGRNVLNFLNTSSVDLQCLSTCNIYILKISKSDSFIFKKVVF